jgi:flagellin
MRELAMQASSDTNGVQEKEITNKEFQQLKNEIYRITAISKYNSKNTMGGTSEAFQSQLVDRAPSSLEFRVGGGTGAGENTIKFKPAQLMMSASDFNISNLSLTTTEGARETLGELDNMIGKVSYSRASLGALQSQLTRSATVEETTVENTSAANSRIRDLDYANETATNIKNKIISDTNTAVQVQANSNSQIYVKLLS